MNKKILLVGGGGHCKSVLDTLIETKQYSEIGIIDKCENIGKHILGISIIGCDDDLSKFHKNGYNYAFVTIGSVGNTKHRIRLFDFLEKIGFDIPNIVDSTSVISENANMSRGIYVGKNAVINAGASIDKGAIINTSATIEHDCTVGSFSHISTGSVLCGEVHIGDNVHIGANSVIKQQVKIGANTIIGMGSVVLNDIAGFMIAYGNPCKEVILK